ncbi:hypothetical protein DXA09_18490, partial [Absiella sp. AM54-8XD]|uniref:hypothetical protein n=1 Tax=Absiella sp. AM54-8XD TaxID=2292279 RepID=UPI000E989C86
MKETNKEFKTPKVKKKRNQQKNSADSFLGYALFVFINLLIVFYFIVATFFPSVTVYFFLRLW